MEWLVINEKYLNYLREYEPEIPNSDYGKYGYKPIFGILFETENLCYVTAVSHPQDRHKHIKENINFKKVYHPKNDRQLIAVINLNFMFPIPKSEKVPLKYSEITLLRNFKSETEKNKYTRLMKLEMQQINKMDLTADAKKVYDIKTLYPDSKLASRCVDFKLTEKLAMQYKEE